MSLDELKCGGEEGQQLLLKRVFERNDVNFYAGCRHALYVCGDLCSAHAHGGDADETHDSGRQ